MEEKPLTERERNEAIDAEIFANGKDDDKWKRRIEAAKKKGEKQKGK